jgi:type II secretory pathway component PulF
MATLIKAGISFIRCLDTLEEQTANKKLKAIIRELKVDLEGGSSFSDALAKFPRVFSPLYTGMVKVGEEAGVLDEILDRLATLLEHESVTKQRVQTAVRYPLIVVSALTAAFFFLTAFVVPKFAAVYATTRAALPMPTRVLIWISAAVTDYWWLIIVGALALFFGIRFYVRTTSGRWHYDRTKLRFPLIGSIVQKAVMARFARIFATLYRSGIPILHGLDVVTSTLGNLLIARAVEVIKEDVSEGSGLVAPMQRSKMFPPIVVQMVGVGEETGALDEMLNKVADYYDSEVEYSIRNLSTTLEPVLLAILAGMILFLALGVFLPMWDMISAFKR